MSDEGFVQTGVTESLSPAATRVLRAHETLFHLGSLEPRRAPSGRGDPARRRILPTPLCRTASPYAGRILDKAADPVSHLGISTFTAKAGPSLPRLRYGNSYRVRARIVDLAGNSVFDPVDAAFAVGSGRGDSEFVFRRFEPVGPPPVMLPGGSQGGEVGGAPHRAQRRLRRQAEDPRSSDGAASRPAQDVGSFQAERHGHFDSTTEMRNDATAYSQASDEAGPLTHELDTMTNTLKVSNGVKEIDDAAVHRTYWLPGERDVRTIEVPARSLRSRRPAPGPAGDRQHR